jgi:hypothetical protein
VYYRNHWTGACAGPADLTIGNQTLSWIPATPAILAQLTTSGFGFPVGTEAVDSTAPSVAFSDSQFLDAQNSVVTQGTVGKAFAGIMSTAVANEGLSDAGAGTPVGAVVFEWVLGVQGDGNPAPFTNITQQQAAALIKTGFLPLSVFTGNAADSSNYVILTGRNEDSGTRYDTFAESQTGFGQNAVQFMIKQANHAYPANNLYPFSSGTALSVDTGIAGFQSWPKTAGANSWAFNTDPTLDWKTPGHSGYINGGDVATILRTPNPVVTTGWVVPAATQALFPSFTPGTTKVYVISYLGVSDGNKITSGNAVNGTALTYNGVSFSTSNVANGNYSFWAYEHEYYLTGAPVATAYGTTNPVGLGTGAQEAADAIANTLVGLTQAQLGAAGVPYPSLQAVRGNSAGSFIN